MIERHLITETHIKMLQLFCRDKTNANRGPLRTMAREFLPLMIGRRSVACWIGYNNTAFGWAPLTLSRTIDMLPYETLIELVAKAFQASLGGIPGGLTPVDLRRWDAALDNLKVAMCDPNKCAPKSRGVGINRGQHQHSLNGSKFEMHRFDDSVIKPLLKLITETTAEVTPMAPTEHGHDTLLRIAVAVLDTAHEHGHSAEDVLALEMVKGLKMFSPITRKELLTADIITVDDLDDGENHIAGACLKELMSKTPAKAEMPALDIDLSAAVNALLKQTTKGEISEIGDFYKQRMEASLYKEQVEKLTKELVERVAVPSIGEVKIDGASLTYEVVQTKAAQHFVGPKGEKSSVLNFNVPTLIWKNAEGIVVRHPDCPAIDKAYKFRLKYLLKFLTAFVFNQPIWAHGHTGTGKTTFAEQVAARLGFPFDRLNLDSNLERADIVGSVEITAEGGTSVTKFREGILPRLMQQPYMFVLDEIDAGRPDMLFVIQRALEGKGITLTEDGGRTVLPHPFFRFVATANSRGQGDEHGWYQGVRPMNLAMLNRFGAFIEFDYLDKDDEMAMLGENYPTISSGKVSEMCQFAQEVRVAFKGGEISQTLSPRGLHAMAQYYQHFCGVMDVEKAMMEAVESVVIDAAPADCEQRIRELASRVFN